MFSITISIQLSLYINFPLWLLYRPPFLRNLALFTPLMLKGYWKCNGLKNQGFSTYPFIWAFLHLVIASGMQNGAKHIWTEKLGKRVWNHTLFCRVLSLGTYSKKHSLIIADLGFPFPERIPKSNLLRGSAAQHSEVCSCYLYQGPGFCQQPFGLDAIAQPWSPTQTTWSPPGKSICCSWLG